MPASALVPGTKPGLAPLTANRLAALLLSFTVSALVSFLGFSSCAKREASSNSKDQSFLGADDEDDEDEGEEEGGSGGNDLGLPHPAKPSAWHVRTFVTTQPQPPVAKVTACIEQVAAIAKDAENEQGLAAGQIQVGNLIGTDLAVYHYCFYQMMLRLDMRMEAGGPLMDDLATAFFDGMRRLWILARALDAGMGRDTYFKFLARRYIDMSRQYFGRYIEVVTPPLNRLKDQGLQP